MCVLVTKRHESYSHRIQFIIYAKLYEHSYQISSWKEKKYTLNQNSDFFSLRISFIHDALEVNDKKKYNDTYQVSNEKLRWEK